MNLVCVDFEEMGLRGLEMVESFVEKAGSVFLVKNMFRSNTSGWILFVFVLNFYLSTNVLNFNVT